jgi:hypothetical protein
LPAGESRFSKCKTNNETLHYVLTDEGQRVAIFYTKLHNRLLRPLLAAHDPPAPLPLRQALRVINHHVNDYVREARMTA